MATNNAVNLSGSGAVKYDGAGTFSAIAVPITVPNEGTGRSTLTEYAVVTGGTTTTGNVQSIASVGSANQVLTSNGSSALPTMQAAPTQINSFFYHWASYSFSPADSTTYWVIDTTTPQTTHAAALFRFYVPNDGTITRVYGAALVTGTLGSSENVTLFLRKNDTTNTDITTTSQWTATENTYSNLALSISMTAGDYVEFGVTTPAWTTNPTSVLLHLSIYGVF